MDKIEQYTKELGDFDRGMIGQTSARAKTYYRDYSADPKFVKYIGVVQQELIPLARNLAEEKGPITDPDVERIQKGLGETYRPLQDKLDLINEFKTKLKNAIKNKQSVAMLDDDTFNSKYPQLQSMFATQDVPLNTKTGGQDDNDPLGILK